MSFFLSFLFCSIVASCLCIVWFWTDTYDEWGIWDYIREFFRTKKTAKDFCDMADKAKVRNEPKEDQKHYKLVTAQLKRFYKAANKCAKRGSYGFMFREPTLYPEVKTEILAQGFKLELVIPDNDKGDIERWHVTFL